MKDEGSPSQQTLLDWLREDTESWASLDEPSAYQGPVGGFTVAGGQGVGL